MTIDDMPAPTHARGMKSHPLGCLARAMAIGTVSDQVRLSVRSEFRFLANVSSSNSRHFHGEEEDRKMKIIEQGRPAEGGGGAYRLAAVEKAKQAR